MSQTLVGKVAIVTGASSGIGAATARELARRGAWVVLHREAIIPLKYHAIVWLDQLLPDIKDFISHCRHQ